MHGVIIIPDCFAPRERERCELEDGNERADFALVVDVKVYASLPELGGDDGVA